MELIVLTSLTPTWCRTTHDPFHSVTAYERLPRAQHRAPQRRGGTNPRPGDSRVCSAPPIQPQQFGVARGDLVSRQGRIQATGGGPAAPPPGPPPPLSGLSSEAEERPPQGRHGPCGLPIPLRGGGVGRGARGWLLSSQPPVHTPSVPRPFARLDKRGRGVPGGYCPADPTAFTGEILPSPEPSPTPLRKRFVQGADKKRSVAHTPEEVIRCVQQNNSYPTLDSVSSAASRRARAADTRATGARRNSTQHRSRGMIQQCPAPPGGRYPLAPGGLATAPLGVLGSLSHPDRP